MEDPTVHVTARLLEASETDHVADRTVDGDDHDEASWYADWLMLGAIGQCRGQPPAPAVAVVRVN